MSMREVADQFVKAAIEDPSGARAMIEALPELGDEGIYPALVLGDFRRVARALAADPALAAVKGGPEGVEPLVYVCFSRLGMGDLAATARVLLEHGADPDTTCIADGFPDNPLSCLYGASGRGNNPALARVLLEAGANANDGESLYHSVEHPDMECVRLLLQFGAHVPGSNALKHILDREDPDGLRLLLSAGADPNEINERAETALHWAVFRGRSQDILGMLVDAGAALDLCRSDGRTAHAVAVVRGDQAAARYLAGRGASVQLSPLDRLIAGETVTVDGGKPVWKDADERLLVELAQCRSLGGVQALLGAGLPINATGEAGATALHWACWKGYPELVELLLAHGASVEVRDAEFDATPIGWWDHGRQCNPERSLGDYDAVARLLSIDLAPDDQITA